MYARLQRIVSILAFLIGSSGLPVLASEYPRFSEGLRPAVATHHRMGGRVMPVAWSSSVRNVSLFNKGTRLRPITFNPDNYNINLGYVAVAVGSGAVVGTVADMVFDGGIFTVLGALAGAALGGEWYQRGNAAAVVNILNSKTKKGTLANNIVFPDGLPQGHSLAGR